MPARRWSLFAVHLKTVSAMFLAIKHKDAQVQFQSNLA